jgi:hypothetical protein
VAKRIVREMSIGGENCERSIILFRSDTSRFSGGTVGCEYTRLARGNSCLHLDRRYVATLTP